MQQAEELAAALAWIDAAAQGLVDGTADDQAAAALADIAQKAARSRLAFREYMDAPYSGSVLTNPDLTPFAQASNDADDVLDQALRALGRRAGAAP